MHLQFVTTTQKLQAFFIAVTDVYTYIVLLLFISLLITSFFSNTYTVFDATIPVTERNAQKNCPENPGSLILDILVLL
jgi:hypothetical protein